MKAKNMYQLIDRAYHRNKSFIINGEKISVCPIFFLRNDLGRCRECSYSIDNLRSELEADYNRTSIKSILLEKKLLEFLLKI